MNRTLSAAPLRRLAAAAALLLAVPACALSPISDADFAAALSAVPARPPRHPRHPRAESAPFRKVLVIVLENEDYAQAAAQPFLKKLMARGATLTNYYGVTHPSQPNYIAMIAGDTLGVDGDGRVDLPGRQLGDLLEDKGLSWAAYAEDYPGGCFLGAGSGNYARKHLPFLSFTRVSEDPARCARVKPAAALETDLAAGGLPAYSLYVPDLNDDGHDTDVSAADAWLARFLGPKLDDPRFMSGLLVVVTFDEGALGSDNQVLTVLVGDGVVPGAASAARYDHVSLLKTVEQGLGLGDLGRGDASAAPIDGVWKAAAPDVASAR